MLFGDRVVRALAQRRRDKAAHTASLEAVLNKGGVVAVWSHECSWVYKRSGAVTTVTPYPHRIAGKSATAIVYDDIAIGEED